ncbi:deoxyribodipyrimidine photolyase [Photobacterium jeanii]|uniref:Deoxyribodipyrimidine photolyase n=1 Tax=Photobacterium jeanii TaxID=858640 RepID=A0A178K8P8_9GAMM|nr:cryptochrome/photolyase family protein [Photobacterium jeanii]OAN13062.1 deoxyribodipyrimidine photolyase [Photobacterium jeanii]PST89211.1 cryptochrome/photolyase family protein [Photobacterium jeanii]
MENQPKKYTKLRLILGDQLNASHSWYHDIHSQTDTLYVIAELHQEAAYVSHHIQKVCAFFAAMEQFAHALQQAGLHVLHLTLDDTVHYPDLPSLISALIEEYGIQHFEFQRPDEYRLYEQLHTLTLPQEVSCREYDSEHFLLPFSEIADAFPANKHLVMEHFYRRMRKRFDILMDGEKPLGGKWNYDKQNRNKLKAKDLAEIPQPLIFANPVTDIVKRLARHKVNTIGQLENQYSQSHEHILWPVNRRQAIELLDHFCRICLPLFGRFQDAMTDNSPHHWSLYHSRISFALNAKLLNPMQVIHTAIEHYQANQSDIDLAQIEGFVRQILGWREFIRGIYWGNMPHYAKTNGLGANRKLPDYFWTGNTNMACLKSAIDQSLEYAYAHHIQRLMVTGNFCLLTEIAPEQVDEWYLGIYIDAIEWVEMPNTRGMALYADNGILATKPYAASGNYINKMSDHCTGCHYDVKQKIGDNACPLNSLYWRFLDKHQSQLAKNPRTRMIYRSWDQLSNEQQQEVLDQANIYLNNIESL